MMAIGVLSRMYGRDHAHLPPLTTSTPTMAAQSASAKPPTNLGSSFQDLTEAQQHRCAGDCICMPEESYSSLTGWSCSVQWTSPDSGLTAKTAVGSPMPMTVKTWPRQLLVSSVWLGHSPGLTLPIPLEIHVVSFLPGGVEVPVFPAFGVDNTSCPIPMTRIKMTRR